jgi:hypothetical protein
VRKVTICRNDNMRVKGTNPRHQLGRRPTGGGSAAVPVRGVKVVSPHRPDDQRATIYDSPLLAHVWTNCTGADRVLARPERSDMP